MKHQSRVPGPKSAAGAPPLQRRGMLLGTGVAAIAGVAAAVTARTLPATEPTPAAAVPKDTSAEGYRLTQHVLRYYETARV
jgi:nitrous oxide reductase